MNRNVSFILNFDALNTLETFARVSSRQNKVKLPFTRCLKCDLIAFLPLPPSITDYAFDL